MASASRRRATVAPTSGGIAHVDHKACGDPRGGVDRALPRGLGLGVGDGDSGKWGQGDGAIGTMGRGHGNQYLGEGYGSQHDGIRMTNVKGVCIRGCCWDDCSQGDRGQ